MTNSDQKCLIYTIKYATTLFVSFTISLFYLPVNPFISDSITICFTNFLSSPKNRMSTGRLFGMALPGQIPKGRVCLVLGAQLIVRQRHLPPHLAADERGLSGVFIRKHRESPRFPVRREAAHLEPSPERRAAPERGRAVTASFGISSLISLVLPYTL